MKLACIMGITCSGKDHLVEHMAKLWPDEIGLIQVGKEFRKRYPPERFRGQAALPDTEVESWQIFDEQLEAAKDKKLVLCVGQPRMPSQVKEILSRVDDPSFYLLTCSDTELERRMNSRFIDKKEGWYTLALERRTNDKVQLYDCIVELVQDGQFIHSIFDTTEDLDQVCQMIKENECQMT